uniref:Uncharacterized protein MANES_03G180900 n=1 Tax=Rhizophora mucronata TaxID=61149 RepID=A0A2P2J6Y6_RHIMU
MLGFGKYVPLSSQVLALNFLLFEGGAQLGQLT